MSSAVKAEVGTVEAKLSYIYKLPKYGILRTHLFKTDNDTAQGALNQTLKHKQSKAFDILFHWMIDRIKQKQLRVYWDKGIHNLAYYFTKHHPPLCCHKVMRPTYIHIIKQPVYSSALVQGCVNISKILTVYP